MSGLRNRRDARPPAAAGVGAPVAAVGEEEVTRKSSGKKLHFKTRAKPYLYPYIRALFNVGVKTFYRSIWVDGMKHVPPKGVPTLLCFNHGNGLGDPAVVIAVTPRIVRFIAKDTVFKDPTTAALVSESGAIPIERQREWGENRDNLQAYAAVFDALEHGQCLGMAPEGLSRFHPDLAPLKTGAARIALEMCRRHRGETDYAICILPCSLTYLHREKWRSDVLVTFGAPIQVTPDMLADDATDDGGGAQDEAVGSAAPLAFSESDYDAAKELTERLRRALTVSSFFCSDWKLIRLATTACRLWKRYGTKMTLTEYIRTTRHFLDLFDPKATGGAAGAARMDPEEAGEAMELLQRYRDLLTSQDVVDDDIRRAANAAVVGNARRRGVAGGRDMPRGFTLLRLAGIILAMIPTFVLTLPGLAMWLPALVFIRWKVTTILKRPGGVQENADVLAEFKLLFTTMYIMGLCVVVFVALKVASALNAPYVGGMSVARCLGAAFVGVPMVFFSAVRIFEVGISLFREVVSGVRLAMMSRETMASLVQLRDMCMAAVQKLGKTMPPHVEGKDTVVEMAPNVFMGLKTAVKRSDWTHEKHLLGRRREDWNTMLGVEDENKDIFT